MGAVASAVVKRFLCRLALTFAVCLFFLDTNAQSVLLADIDESEELTFNEYSELTGGKSQLFFIGSTFWNSEGKNKELWTTRTTVENTDETVMLKRFVTLSHLTIVGTRLYFVADDGVSGPELWKSDGTAAGTVMIKDIRPGSTGSEPDRLTNVRGTLYFSANNGTSGRELWKSNGSLGGTVLVRDILPKGGNGNPTNLTDVNGTLFFAANDGTNGIELWKSDGTADGTMMVKDIRPGTRVNISPDNLVNVYGTLFFVAADATGGRELWKSDGATEGTIRVKDILPGTSPSRISNTTAVYKTGFFSATDGVHGQELWKSDGTEAGTVMVKDMTPGPKGSQGTGGWDPPMANFTNISGTLFFTAFYNGFYYMWKSNGTAQGTIPLQPARGPGISDPWPRFTLMNDRIYYFNGDENEYDPFGFWSMDRNGTDHQRIVSFEQEDAYNPYYPDMAVVGNTFYISGRPDYLHGFKLVKTDGTPEGTTWLDIKTTTEGSDPNEFTHFNGRLFFRAKHSWYQQHDLWVTDGTPAGTTLFSSYDEEVDQLVLLGNNIYASALSRFGIYKTDLITGNTALILEDYDSDPIDFITALNGALLFSNGNGELWKTDGTTAGTVQLKDFHQISAMNVLNGKLIFKVLHEDYAEELWISNGTVSGTAKLKTFSSGRTNRSAHYPTVIIGNTLYFVANDGIHSNEVWKTDGTASGTLMVTDLNTQETWGLNYEDDIRNVSAFRDTLYISARGDDGKWALYKSNGTSSGTMKVTNINPIVYSIVYGDELLLFTLEDGEADSFSETDLWATDGTAAGTRLVYDLNSWNFTFSHEVVNDILYFSTREGGDLWRTNGTACGTFKVDIGSREASPIESIGSTLIIGSYDQQAGNEPHAYNTADAPASPCGDAVARLSGTSDQTSTNRKLLTSYPNPFNNDFAFRLEGKDDDLAQLRFFTLYGKPVEEIGEVKANTDYRIGQSWRPGVYILQVIQRGVARRYIVVKE